MRVCHVISSIDARTGGPAVALGGLTRAQAAAGMSVEVLATYRTGEDLSAAEQMRGGGVEVNLVGPALGPLLRHPELAERCRTSVARADVLHVHGLWEAVQHRAAAVARRRPGKPYVFRPCGMLDPWSLAQRRWKKRIYLAWRLRGDLNRAAALHYTTAAERDLAAPVGLRARAIVEPNGVDLAEFEMLPQRGTFRRAAGLSDGQPLILFLSRLHPKKGLELLIPAFAMADVPRDTVLAVVGPDSDGYRAKVEALAKEQGVGQRVIFPGMLAGRSRIEAMVDADLFVLPSHQENFGNVVVEALAAGTPVIVSDKVNLCEDVRQGSVGAVVPLDAAALSAELGRWMGDEGLRAAAAGRARAFVSERFDWREIARRWGGHYASLVEGA
jgi:glycosyltransferase involved in cell wall biosynthesis